MRCDLQIFSGCVCHLEQLHAQSPFLFPIVFSINLIPFFDICSVDYLLFFHPGCSCMCCFTWAAARSQHAVCGFGSWYFVIHWRFTGKSRQAHQRTQSFLYAKWYWVNHGRLTSEQSCTRTLDRLNHGRLTSEQSCTRTLDRPLNASTRSVYAKWYWVNHGRLTSERKAYLPLPIVTHQSLDPAARALKRQASCLLRVDAFATPANNHALEHSESRQALNASTRSVYAKWYWVNHGRLTSERKAYLPLPIVTHQSLFPAARALKRQASCLLRVGAFATRRRGNHMHDHSRFQRDIE